MTCMWVEIIFIRTSYWAYENNFTSIHALNVLEILNCHIYVTGSLINFRLHDMKLINLWLAKSTLHLKKLNIHKQ